jgi:hypothetical protein
MDEQPESVLAAYPLVRHAQAGPAPGGEALLVEAVTADGVSVRFAIPLLDVQHFVAFLLISVGGIGVVRGDQDRASDAPIAQSLRSPRRRSPSVSRKATKATWELPSDQPSSSSRSRWPPSASWAVRC